MAQFIDHQFYPEIKLTFALYPNVAPDKCQCLRRAVMSGELEVTLLKTAMIADPFQVLVAANKAVHLYKTGKMATKNVHSEVLFCLSPTKNIKETFSKFGMGDKDSSVFVVIVNDQDNKTLSAIESRLDATPTQVDEVSNLADRSAIQKMYKVTDQELTHCSLVDCLASKIASKEFITV